MSKKRNRPAAMVISTDAPAGVGEVDMKDVFRMQVNDQKTALNVFKGPDGNYMVHFADTASQRSTVGFLSRSDIKSLFEALGRELVVGDEVSDFRVGLGCLVNGLFPNGIDTEGVLQILDGLADIAGFIMAEDGDEMLQAFGELVHLARDAHRDDIEKPTASKGIH